MEGRREGGREGAEFLAVLRGPGMVPPATWWARTLTLILGKNRRCPMYLKL